jgi:hypothetical protein
VRGTYRLSERLLTVIGLRTLDREITAAQEQRDAAEWADTLERRRCEAEWHEKTAHSVQSECDSHCAAVQSERSAMRDATEDIIVPASTVETVRRRIECADPEFVFNRARAAEKGRIAD